MPVQYLTEEWAELALQKVEEDRGITRAVEGIELSILAIVLGAPKGCYGFVYVHFDGDGLAEYRVGYDYAAVTKGVEPPTFVVSGQYDVFAAINRGKLSERRALLTGKLHLTGSLVKALRYMRAMEAVTKALNSIPCRT